MNKKMQKLCVPFEILYDSQPNPIGWSRSSEYLIFDVKMDFTLKARWVKDGQRTP